MSRLNQLGGGFHKLIRKQLIQETAMYSRKDYATRRQKKRKPKKELDEYGIPIHERELLRQNLASNVADLAHANVSPLWYLLLVPDATRHLDIDELPF